MSTGFSGAGSHDFYAGGGVTGRSMMNMNNAQGPYRSPLAGILPDPASQIAIRRSELIGKRTLSEFQQQQQSGLGLFLRNVKPRNYQLGSPLSPLSPMDFSASLSPEAASSISSMPMATRYGLPVFQQLRSQPISLGNGNVGAGGMIFPSNIPNNSGESEKKMMNRLQELEKQLLDDNDVDEGDAASVVTNSEWSETIQNLISPSPTSSTSSSSCSSNSPMNVSPKQSIAEAAAAISDGKTEVAVEILTRLNQVSNVRGTSEQRLTAYMASAMRSRLNPSKFPPPSAELHSKEHIVSTQMLYKLSPCFKIGFMAANLAILESTLDKGFDNLHVVDFDIGHGGQYVHLLQEVAARKANRPKLKITTVSDAANVGEGLKGLATNIGVELSFKVLNLKVSDLSAAALGLEKDDVLAVNFAFRLYRLPDESVTLDNLRDELLRRVKALSPKVVTVVEQEMNANTSAFPARANELYGYYGALFDSLAATVPSNSDRVRVEEGLSRRIANSVACEGWDRVERCEVYGKWRARMGMAGFDLNPVSQSSSDSLRSKLNSWTRGNPGFTVGEQSGGICFGWMGRTLTVASAWR